MAVTIINNFTSNKFYPVANPLTITVDSNQSGNCSFRYICDIYINTVKVFTSKLYPDPLTGKGFFSISSIVSDYIKNVVDKTPQLGPFSNASEAFAPSALIQVQCKFGEEYDSSVSCNGTIVQYNNLATSNTFYAFNGAIPYEDYLSWNYSNYVGVWASASHPTKFLSNSPKTMDVTYNDTYCLDILSLTNPTVATNGVAVEIETFNYNGSSTKTYLAANTLSGNLKRYRIWIGPSDINKRLNQLLINASIKHYTVRLVWKHPTDTTYPSLSETYTFKVINPSKYTTRIGFIGQLGSVEHVTLYHRNVESLSIDRGTFKKNQLSNYSSNWTYQVGDRQTTTWKMNVTERHNVSCYVNDKMATWLRELHISPEAWVYKRPEIMTISIYMKAVTPAGYAKMIMVFPPDHGIVAGDTIWFVPCNDPINDPYKAHFTVLSVDGREVDCGLPYSVWNYSTFVDGYAYKADLYSILPISVSNPDYTEGVRTDKPWIYSIDYTMAFNYNAIKN